MTSSLEAQVLADKALRDTNKFAFDSQLASLKHSLADKGIASRMVSEATDHAKAAFNEASEVVQEHPGVVAGTIMALALWFLRNPIIRWLDNTFGHRD